MPSCFSCGQKLKLSDRVGRAETCPSCGADLHCCRNCKFFDPASYNECREPVAERVVEKDRSNFCDYFQIAEDPLGATGSKAQDTKKKLEELFKKS